MFITSAQVVVIYVSLNATFQEVKKSFGKINLVFTILNFFFREWERGTERECVCVREWVWVWVWVWVCVCVWVWMWVGVSVRERVGAAENCLASFVFVRNAINLFPFPDKKFVLKNIWGIFWSQSYLTLFL